MAANDPTLPVQVFISYAREDCAMARRLCADLKKAGVKPWLDVENLLPGQRWKIMIDQAIRQSSYLIAVLSSHSISKEGYVQKELRIALDVVEELPPYQVFVIPVRLDDCEPRHEWLRELHRADLFPPEQYQEGLARILQALGCAAQDEEQAPDAPSTPFRQKPQHTEKTRKPPAILLRSEPLAVSPEKFSEVFHLDENGRPLEYIQNDYEDQGEVVVDHATGLLWQKSGSENIMYYKDAPKYIEELNRKRFAGYEDWRLPTIPELMSLLEPEKQSNGLYINSIFNKRQLWCWSCDKRSSAAAWVVGFHYGLVNWGTMGNLYYVRVVHS